MSAGPSRERRALLALLAFLGLTAVGGAWGLLSGVITSGQWLDQSPFDGLRIPGFALLGVGVLALVATALVWRRGPFASESAAVAGNGIVIFEAVEATAIGFHILQAAYVAIGSAIITLAWRSRD